jgi:nitrous oxide reductase
MARASTQNVRDLIVSGSAIYVGLAAGTSVDGVAASTVAVGGAVAGTAARAAVARRAERRGVAAHELFYLYEVDRRL